MHPTRRCKSNGKVPLAQQSDSAQNAAPPVSTIPGNRKGKGIKRRPWFSRSDLQNSGDKPCTSLHCISLRMSELPQPAGYVPIAVEDPPNSVDMIETREPLAPSLNQEIGQFLASRRYSLFRVSTPCALFLPLILDLRQSIDDHAKDQFRQDLQSAALCRLQRLTISFDWYILQRHISINRVDKGNFS